jgi:hypothetical protein
MIAEDPTAKFYTGVTDFDLGQGHFSGPTATMVPTLAGGTWPTRQHSPSGRLSVGMRYAMLDGRWHFLCPECGMGEFELGRLATDQEFVCGVCLEEDRSKIRLKRWTDDTLLCDARLRPGLAA